MIPLLHDAQTFFRERYGVTEVFQTDFLLDVVVILGGKGSDEIFYRNPRVGGSLTLQFLQLLVGGRDVEAVEDSPVQVNPRIKGMVEYVAFGCRTSIGTEFRIGTV